MRNIFTKLIRIGVNSITNPYGIELREMKPYEKNRYKWLSQMGIQSVFDIGANSGQFVAEFGKYFPNAKIYSFEPLSDIYEALCENTKTLGNVRAFNVALGDCNGTSVIKRNQFSPSSSLLEMSSIHKNAFPITSETYDEVIEVRRLDDFLEEKHIEVAPEILLKIDVQGFEDKVISGSMELLKKTKIVIVETSFCELYQGQPLFGDIYNLLTQIGFRYQGSIDIDGYDPQNGKPLFSDSIFIRPT
jgi:FkbM family methyltransferase